MREAIRDVASLPSVQERRRRNRQEVVDAILAMARVVMQEQGVAALNLNEVARRLGMSSQALAKYFPSKATLYDALFLMGHRLFREADEEVWRTTPPNWARIERWFEVRFTLACAHPDLYQLIWGGSVPGLAPSEAAQDDIRRMLAGVRRGIGDVIEDGALDAGMAPERVVDILMAVRHGIIAEYLGKRDFLPPGSDRFRGLIPDVVVAFERAWGSGQGRAQHPTSRGALAETGEEEGGIGG